MTMIDRQKKKFVVLVIGLSLYLGSTAKSQQYSVAGHQLRHRKLLTMTRKPCQDAEGNKGVCIFKWDCLSQEGVSLSTCVDGFLFGSCCKLKVEPEIFPSEEHHSENRIDATTHNIESDTTNGAHSQNSSDTTWKTSNFEPYYNGVTYSFHGDDINAEHQDVSGDSGVPLIYTLGDKMQHEEMDGSFIVSHKSTVSDVTTTATEVTQDQFPLSRPQSSFTGDSSSKTETFSRNNVSASSLSEISSLSNFPIVYTLTSRMPSSVYNHSNANDNIVTSGDFGSTEKDVKRPVTVSLNSTATSPASTSQMSKGTSHISTSFVTEVTELYSFGTSSDDVTTHSGLTDFFHTHKMEEIDTTAKDRNYETDLNDVTSTVAGADETNFPTVEERNKMTQDEHFAGSKTTIYNATGNTTEALSTETIPFYGNNSTGTAHETSHNNNSAPFSSSELPFVQNATGTDYYDFIHTETYTPSVTEIDTENGNLGNPQGTSVSHIDTSETTIASKFLVNKIATTSSGGLLLESADSYNTSAFEDYVPPKTITVEDSGTLPPLANTLSVNDLNTTSEKLNAVRNRTDHVSTLSDYYTQSYVNEGEIIPAKHHSPLSTLSENQYNQYNNEIVSTLQYINNTTETTFDLVSLSEDYNSSLIATQDPVFDSTWFLIKLSEFFWDNFTFNESADGFAPESHEITTIPNYSDAANVNAQHVTHPVSYPTETQTHHEPPSYSIPITSNDNLHSSVTSLLEYQTDITDRDETIYQNLLSIMGYNGKPTTPVDHSQNNVKLNNTFGDDEEPELLFQKSTASGYTNPKDGVTESETNEYEYSQGSEYASTIPDSSSYDQTDTKHVNFVTEVQDSLVSLTTVPSESNTVDKNMQITTEENVEIDIRNHTLVMNLDDVEDSHEEYLVNEPQKSSSFDNEDTTFSETSKHGMDTSTTAVSLIYENATESNLNPTLFPNSQESGSSETNPSILGDTKEATFEAVLTSSTSHVTAFPTIHEETTAQNSSEFIVLLSTDSNDSTNHTMFHSPQEETTIHAQLFNFTDGVSTDFLVFTSTEDASTATYLHTVQDSSTTLERVTTNIEMTTSEKETTVGAEAVSETVTKTPLMTTSKSETTTRSTETSTRLTHTSSGKETTTNSVETSTLTKLMTISISPPWTSRDPTYTTQKYTVVPQKVPSPPKLDYRKNCGVRTLRPSGRIVGGKDTFYGKWPWQALVKEATWWGLFVKNKCGGVLINSRFVITAAHCQPGFLGTLIVVLGAHDLTGAEDYLEPVARNVRRMVVHRHYNAQTFENDLALLEMESPVDFLPHVVPICLPHRREGFTGKMAFVTGWGKLTHGGDVPNILQEVQVPIVTNGECQKMYLHAGHEKLIRSHFVCAGYSRGGQDSCEGDSGGPLMVQRDDSRWVLVGTVSHGIGCADPNLPGVYMRMSAYRPWIDSIIRGRKLVRHKQPNSTYVMTKKTRRSRTLVFYI